MTEGFEIFPQNVAKDGTLIIIQKGLKLYNITDVVDLLNELTEENSKLHIQNDFLKDENQHMRTVLNENEQLKQRNENQYQQLNQLWKLIEAKDWETLTAMDNQMKEDEERLQREWK